MHYRARSYDPRIGRFLQKDPVEDNIIKEHYLYCSNYPTGSRDPNGTQSYDQIKAIAKQLGYEKSINASASGRIAAIQYIQKQLGLKKITGKWNPDTYNAYQDWLSRNKSETAIKLVDPADAHAFYQSLATATKNLSPDIQEFVQFRLIPIAYAESYSSKYQLGEEVEFNLAAGGFGQGLNSTEAGLLQINNV